MSFAETMRKLERWQDAMLECEDRLQDLAELLGISREAPLQDAIGRLMGAYTQQVAESTGVGEEWLQAWWNDHHFGSTPMQAGLNDEPLRDITNLSALVRLVLADEVTA